MRAITSRAGRFSAANSVMVNWSRTVVTPNRSESSSAAARAWMWASSIPGRSVRPAPSTRGRSSGRRSRCPTRWMRPSSIQTSRCGRNSVPSKTVVSTMAKRVSAAASPGGSASGGVGRKASRAAKAASAAAPIQRKRRERGGVSVMGSGASFGVVGQFPAKRRKPRTAIARKKAVSPASTAEWKSAGNPRSNAMVFRASCERW